MGERETGINNQLQQAPSSRLGLRTSAGAGGGAGEIVEVQGGHIVRSTGRKDRHSKVCTAKGPRDRRVRLSAHTAIQFYDVQDRLGYDRPSKAVDWLIKKAKAAIDELDELPAWHPTASVTAPPNLGTHKPDQDGGEEEDEEGEEEHQHRKSDAAATGSGKKKPMEAEESGYGLHHLDHQTSVSGSGAGPGLLPPSLDSDAIADTIKSFFPMASSSSSIHFQNYPPDLLSRTTSSQAQDLRLSLQSFQDPILLHHHHHSHHHHQNQTPPSEQTFFSVTAPMTFDTETSSTWSEHQQSVARFHRMVAWNPADPAGGGGGYVFGQGPQPATQLLAQNQFFPQRGPLQSSNSPSVRAWAMDPTTMADHPSLPHSSPATGFASGSFGFSGFRIPARIQGEEEHDAVGSKPAASASRH